MAAFLDVCRFIPTAGGTSAWTFASAVGGYQSPTSAGAVNGTKYKYRAESADLTQWEVGEGTWNSSTSVLSRTTVLSNSSGTGTAVGQSGAGTLINFSTVPQVAVVALAEDLISPDGPNSFSGTQQANMRAALAAVGAVRVTKFTTNGTYTPDPNLIVAMIECQGSGGAGGSCAASAANDINGAGGGGSGAYALKWATKTAIGTPQTVAVGAGGVTAAAGQNNGGNGNSSSVGTLCVAGGGLGGTGAPSNDRGAGGAGSSTGTGDVVINGKQGAAGFFLAGSTLLNAFLAAGGGADSARFGGGAAATIANTAGNAATSYGGGGSGASDYNGGGAKAGGAGFQGIVIITEFCAS
jgi:hypothetical protein